MTLIFVISCSSFFSFFVSMQTLAAAVIKIMLLMAIFALHIHQSLLPIARLPNVATGHFWVLAREGTPFEPSRGGKP